MLNWIVIINWTFLLFQYQNILLDNKTFNDKCQSLPPHQKKEKENGLAHLRVLFQSTTCCFCLCFYSNWLTLLYVTQYTRHKKGWQFYGCSLVIVHSVNSPWPWVCIKFFGHMFLTNGVDHQILGFQNIVHLYNSYQMDITSFIKSLSKNRLKESKLDSS